MNIRASGYAFFHRPSVALAAVLTSAILWAGTGFAHSEQEEGGKSRILTLKLRDFKAQMRELVEGGYDIAGANPSASTVDIVQRINSQQSFNKEIFGQVIESKIIDTAKAPDVGYKTSVEVDEIVHRLANNYPDLVTVESFGRTHEGRDLWAIRVTSKATQKSGKPVVFLNALHHAREVMTVEVALDAADYLAANYATNNEVHDWLDRAEIWIVPMVNPDGSNKVWTEDSMWRKNTSGSDGVDVNRNYPYRWNQCNGSSGSPSSDTYRGPSAGSENETQAMMALVGRIRPVYSISFHSYSELVLYPYSCDGEHVPQREVVEGGGKAMAQLLPSDGGGSGKYAPGTSWEILYAVDGGDIDWMYNTHNVIPYVIELNSTSQGFQPSFSTWRNKTVNKVRAAWQYVIRRALQSGVRGKVTVAGESIDDAVVRVISMTKEGDAGQMISVKGDGTFHAVVVPGSYKVVVARGERTVEKTVLVGGDLVTLDVAL